MMSGSKGQKAVHACMIRLLILESAKYEKFYHVSHAVYGQSVKNSMAWLMWREIIRYIMMRSMKKDSVWQVWILSESVSQFFHILGSVDQQRGCCEVADGKYEITLYTSCCNVTKGIYYYNTYENHQISAVICIEKIWTARLWSVIRWSREKKSISRTDAQRMKEGRLDEKESPSGRSQFQFK